MEVFSAAALSKIFATLKQLLKSAIILARLNVLTTVYFKRLHYNCTFIKQVRPTYNPDRIAKLKFLWRHDNNLWDHYLNRAYINKNKFMIYLMSFNSLLYDYYYCCRRVN